MFISNMYISIQYHISNITNIYKYKCFIINIALVINIMYLLPAHAQAACPCFALAATS